MKRASTFIFILVSLLWHTVQAQTKYDAFTVKASGNGQPIIFIPGATCSGDEWKETVAHLGGKYQCHVITIAGYAGTAPMSSGPYLDKVKDQLEQYITDNKLSNVILVGHSIGGFLSLRIAAEMKSNLQKVVVVDAMPFFAAASNPNAADTFSAQQAESMYQRYTGMSTEQLRASQLMMAKFMCLDSTRWNQIADWGVQSDKKTMAYTMMEMLGKDMRQQIANIKVPVLVLAAFAEQPQYPRFNKQAVTAMYEGQYKQCATCRVHVAEGKTKHFIMYDNPEWMYKEMDSFIAGK